MSDAFKSAIQGAGLTPPPVIFPGKIHRFPGHGKGDANKAGWCLLFENCRGGSFGDFSTGLSETWIAERRKAMSSTERRRYRQQVRKAQAGARAERKKAQAAAVVRASHIWSNAPPAPADHGYLITKQIKPYNARLHKGALVLPAMNFDRDLTSLQFIGADGSKVLLTDGRKQGCFISVAGNFGDVRNVIICEGWATGATLADDSPDALVLAAIDAGNLKPVAVQARHRWPNADIVIAGDDDRKSRGNPGATKARLAAVAAKARLVMPQWPTDAPDTLTDFNDLALWMEGGRHG